MLNKDVYEKIINGLMNKSKKIFPESLYTHVEEQSKGEPDHISLSGKKYDDKVLFLEEQCAELRKRTGDINKFVNYIQSQTNDMYYRISNNKDLIGSIFYGEIIKKMKKTAQDEDVILFLPYVYTLEMKESITDIFCLDIFTLIFKCVQKNNESLVGDKNVYLIYLDYTNKVILKKLNTGEKEYIETNLLKEYIEIIL